MKEKPRILMYEKLLLWFVLYCLVYNVTSSAGDHRMNMMNEVTASKRPILPTDIPLSHMSVDQNIYEERHLIFAIIFCINCQTNGAKCMEVRWWGKNFRSRKMWKVSSHGSRLCGLSAFVTWRCYKRNWTCCQLRSHHCNWFITSTCGANSETRNSPSRRCLNRTSQRAKTLPR